MSDESKMAEHPTLPAARPANREQAAAQVIALRHRRGKHSQLCPVWTGRGTIDRCNCWILHDAQQDATTALAAADVYDATQAKP